MSKLPLHQQIKEALLILWAIVKYRIAPLNKRGNKRESRKESIMPKHTRVRRITVDQSKYFRGEKMTCAICGKQKRSNPQLSSNWRLVEVDGKPYYVCTKHFPPDTASATEFSVAYLKVFEVILGKEK